MPDPLLIYGVLGLAILIAFLGIVLVNLWILPSLSDHEGGDAPQDTGLVTVLVPARNEESNIEACLRSLLEQDYPNLKVWLYDDASTDRTLQIATALAEHHPTLHIVQGRTEPPPGWLGKANACHRLYAAMRAVAAPEYVLFTDADVRFEPQAVSRAVATLRAQRAGLLSIFPRQVTGSWAERLAVPTLLHWTVYNFLPLPAAFSTRAGSAFAAANGQFMLFTREAYEACGGHMAVRSQILEDVALSREVKRAGNRAILADGGPLVRTRMYNGADEVWKGYSKNAYAFFGYSPAFLALGVLVLLALYVAPPVVALAAASRGATGIAVLFALQYFVAVAAKAALAVRFKYPVGDALLHPVAVLYMVAIQVNSMLWSLTGRGAWKGRGMRSERGET